MEFINRKVSYTFFVLLLIPLITFAMDDQLIPLKPKSNTIKENRFQVLPDLKGQPNKEHTYDNIHANQLEKLKITEQTPATSKNHSYDNITQVSDEKDIVSSQYENTNQNTNVNHKTKKAIINTPSLRFLEPTSGISSEGKIVKTQKNSNINPFRLAKNPNDIIIELVNDSGTNLEITLRPQKIAKAFGKAEILKKSSDEKLMIVIPNNEMYLSVVEPGTSTYGTFLLGDQIKNLKNGQTISLIYDSIGNITYRIKE